MVSVDRAYAWGIATYLEHPSKASRWEDGRFVVQDDARAEDCTVWFSLEPDGDEARWEGILGRRLAPDRARLCGIPLFVAGVILGDEVSLVESGEGAPVTVEVVARSGNLTYRVLFPERGGEDERWHRWSSWSRSAAGSTSTAPGGWPSRSRKRERSSSSPT